MMIKNKNKTALIFDFWHDNKLDAHYTLTIGDVVSAWSIWLNYQIKENKDRGQKWYDYYYGEQAVMCFIADKKSIFGLQSVNNSIQFPDLYKLLKKYF